MNSSPRVLFFGFAASVVTAIAQTQDQGLVNAPGAGRPISTPVEVSGKVVLEDATPPPQSAFIRASCGVAGVQETHTDKKGRFELMFGAFTPAPTGWNALGTPHNRGETYTCDLSVTLEGFRTVKLVTRSGDLGIVVLKPLGAREGYTISVNNALAPAEAKLAYDKGRQLITKGKLQDARKELSKAVELYPKYASAWTELGKIQMNANDLPAVRLSLQKAIEADPKYLPPYEQLMTLALREEKWQELADTSDRIIKLNAFDYPEAYYLNAVAHLNLNHPDAAEKSAREALKQDPQKFVRAHYILGLALARQGQLMPAAGELKAYLASAGPLTESETQMIGRQIREVETLASHMNVAKP